MNSTDTAMLRRAGEHKGKLALGGSAAILYAVWQMFIQPMQQSNSRQWQAISALKTNQQALELRVLLLERQVGK